VVKSVELYYYLFISIMLGYPVHVCFTKNNLLLYFSYGIQLCTAQHVHVCTNTNKCVAHMYVVLKYLF